MISTFWSGVITAGVLATVVILAKFVLDVRRGFSAAVAAQDPLARTVIRYEGALEGKKMRVHFELGDGTSFSMLIDRHVAQKMSDDLLIGVARIDTLKTGDQSS